MRKARRGAFEGAAMVDHIGPVLNLIEHIGGWYTVGSIFVASVFGVLLALGTENEYTSPIPYTPPVEDEEARNTPEKAFY